MPTSKAISASKFFGKDRYEYYLNELLTEQTLGGQQLSKEQIKEGFSKRKNKISFEKFVDSVVSTGSAKAALSPGVSPVAPGGDGLGPKGSALIKSPGGALQKFVEGVSKTSQVGGIESDISIITKTVVSIADILSKQKKFNEDAAAYEKRKAEQDKRALAENKLEKRFEGLKKAAEKVLAPVKSILDKIINFLVTVFLGRVVFKLIEWFGDPKNAEKVKTIIRFLGDQWPKLLSLYLVFGTSFGRFAKGLLKVVARGGIKLLGFIAKLAAAKKIRGARKVARFLGGGKGRLLGNVIGTAAAVGGTYALTQGLSGNDEPEAQGFRGGGFVIPRFFGGGFNFGSLFNGLVSGEKGVDKVPAMLTDGEFVMSAGAVQKYGVDTLEAMNAAGGGTNQPKIMSGTTYAQGGGYIGSDADKKEYTKDPILEKREKTINLQLQAQKALSSGKGVNIRGAKLGGAQLGTGYSVKYQGKNSIIIKDGAKNFSTGIGDKEITLGGIRYFAMKRGGDVIYVPQDSRDRNSGGGMFQPGGLFGGPRMSARMDYATSKGKYYSSSDKKTYANYNDALAAKKSRMIKLASQQGLDKLSFAGANRSSRGVRIDVEDKARRNEFRERGGILGQLNRAFIKGSNNPDVKAADKASEARIKQAGAESIGRYYSSSDGKYYKDYNAAVKAKKIRLAQQQKKSAPAIKPPVKPQGLTYAQRQQARTGRGGGASPSTKTPSFSATSPASSAAKSKTLGVGR